MTTLTAQEICDWLNITFDQLRLLRLRRDATRFPPPLLGEAGLVWYEHDVVSWICYLDDWRAGGSTREALGQLAEPLYLAMEPELRKEQLRNEY